MELLPGDKIKIEALDDKTQRLTVDDVDILSEGYYRCVATNEYGTASTKAELNVTGGCRAKRSNIYFDKKEGKETTKNEIENQNFKKHVRV